MNKDFEIVCNNRVDTVKGHACKFAEFPTLDFFTYKDCANNIVLVEKSTGLEVFRDKTIKAVKSKMIEFLRTHDKSIITSCVNNAKTVKQYKDYLIRKDKLTNDFKNVFGFEPPICMLTNSLDVIRLDNMLHVPSGISTSNYIKNQYGKQACKIVQDFIKI